MYTIICAVKCPICHNLADYHKRSLVQHTLVHQSDDMEIVNKINIIRL